MNAKNKNFIVSDGDYKFRFKFSSFIKFFYFCAIIFPMPNSWKIYFFSKGGVKFTDKKKVFIGYNVWLDSAYPEKITIGQDVIIGAGTKIICHSGGTKLHKNFMENNTKNVVVKNGVLLGVNSILLPGVTVGEGAIVAAGSVVIKDVDDYTLVAGNPAKEIKKLV